jgi:hypothetical protein
MMCTFKIARLSIRYVRGGFEDGSGEHPTTAVASKKYLFDRNHIHIPFDFLLANFFITVIN